MFITHQVLCAQINTMTTSYKATARWFTNNTSDVLSLLAFLWGNTHLANLCIPEADHFNPQRFFTFPLFLYIRVHFTVR